MVIYKFKNEKRIQLLKVYQPEKNGKNSIKTKTKIFFFFQGFKSKYLVCHFIILTVIIR